VIDSDEKRRKSYIQSLRSIIAPIEGLNIDHLDYQDLSILSAAGGWTPISKEINRDGFSIIFGDAIAKGSSKRVNAAENQKRWQVDSQVTPPVYDGFYAALTYGENSVFSCGVDILGLFPLYYYSDGKILLVGSTPELFRHYPSFKTEFCPEGLVGILLLN